ncbi:MAG: hypothetical protein Q9227_002432 [Pyrenula ochraceoflavens]
MSNTSSLLQHGNTGPFSDLEVVQVEHLRQENLQPRLASRNSGRDGLHPYHPRVANCKESNGLIIVNEQNVKPLHSSTKGPSATPSTKSKWTRKRKKRVRAVIIVLVLFVILGTITGGVLASRKNKNSHPSSTQATATATTNSITTALDAIPTPTTTPLDVQTGTYTLSMGLKLNSSRCIGGTASLSAWACQNVSEPEVTFFNPLTAVFQDPSRIASNLKYDAQLPAFNGKVFPFEAVTDKQAPQLGTAMFFFTLFDKLVILLTFHLLIHQVPEGAFSTSSSDSDASNSSTTASSSSNQQIVVGDKPYFCWWNATLFEFFVFNSTTTSSSATSAPSSTPALSHLVKTIEKRVHNGKVAPYCQQMQALEEGSLAPIEGETVKIQEEKDEEDEEQKECECVWENS